jgi:pyrroline-5-carboxylate reductase
MQITIIGAGNIGGAIAKGLYQKKEPSENLRICLSDVNKDKLNALVGFCDMTFTNNVEAIDNADVIIIAVKPWLVEMVIEEIQNVLNPERHLLISVAAGITIDSINKKLPYVFPVYRVIPNTAIELGASMTLIASQNSTDEQDIMIGKFFEKLGKVLFIPETLMSAATSITSCGIAYALRYIRAATEGAVELGFPPQQAQEMIAQTLMGAATLLLHNQNNAEVEIDKVTTPGGLTIKGLNAMEEAGFSRAVIAGLKASL